MSPLLLSLRFLQAQPDSRLVALTRQGHGPAFEALVRRYRAELLAYCRRLQPHSGLAEDALQQTLLQAWKALNEGAEVREVRAWLYRIAHNVSLNHLRAAAAVPQELANATDQPALDQLVEQRLRARAALAGLASLPTLQREALLSTTFDGASHTEVASALGLSSGAVRGLIYRARATLRAAAAAVTPGPVLHWAVRRADVGSGRFPSAGGTLAAGGGAGAAGMIAKGGAVLVLAVAGASGVVLTHHARHHQKPEAQLMRSHHRTTSAGDFGVIADATRALGRSASVAQPGPGIAGATVRRAGAGERARRGAGRGSGGGDRGGSSDGRSGSGDGRGGSDGGSTGGSDGGPTSGSDDGSTSGSDGGSTSGSSDGDASTSTTPAAATSTGSRDGGSSSGSDGGSGSSSSTSTSTTSGSDGDMTASLTTTTAGTSSGSDGGSDGGSSGGGSSGGLDGSSGSSDGTSTSGG